LRQLTEKIPLLEPDGVIGSNSPGLRPVEKGYLRMHFLRRWAGILLVIVSPLQAPARAGPEGPHTLSPDERATLRRYARDTWHGFDALVQSGGLPADLIRRSRDGGWTASVHTSPTDIACGLWSILAAECLELIAPEEAGRRLESALAAVERLERAHGFFFNWYDARTGARLTRWHVDGSPLRPYLSTVDNGWVAAALIMVRNTRPALRARAEALLEPMDFGFLYAPFDPADPVKHPGLLRLGYWPDDGTYANTYGMVNTEARIASYIGIARGQIPPEHYFRIGRCRQAWRGPQQQTPQGVVRTYRGVEVFESHYTYRGMRIVPSWGGSMFEALMVPLVVPEAQCAPRSWGVNHPLYVRAQIEHGRDEAQYGFWGFSPASAPEGGYRTYGVDSLGADPEGYRSDGVVTPHAVFLALEFAPHEAVANLQALEAKFPIYGAYGFLDSVNVSTGRVSDDILALDHGMILAALANALADGAMRRAFVDSPFEAAIRPLLEPEEFTAGPPPSPASPGAAAPCPAP
jgi:hypothetical protein